VPDVNLLAVAAATVVAFVLSSAWYVALADQLAGVSPAAAAAGDRVPPWTVAAELIRSLVAVTVVAGLAAQTGTDDWSGGLWLGLALWVGFPLVLWAGAMLHERAPWRLAAIHAGDWLVKLLVVTVIVSVWR
jgi:hypothetical protein